MYHDEERNFACDHRTRGGQRHADSPFVRVGQKEAEIRVYNPDTDEEFTTTVPVKREVCPTCSGKGSHVNPSVDCGGLSAEDFDSDPDFADSYFSGAYDVPCYECHGQNVVVVIDRERADPEILKLLDDHEKAMREMRLTEAAERAMGA